MSGQGGGVRLTRYGHSCLLVESAGARILVDPGGFSHGFEELTGLDAVLTAMATPLQATAMRFPSGDQANSLICPLVKCVS